MVIHSVLLLLPLFYILAFPDTVKYNNKIGQRKERFKGEVLKKLWNVLLYRTVLKMSRNPEYQNPINS